MRRTYVAELATATAVIAGCNAAEAPHIPDSGISNTQPSTDLRFQLNPKTNYSVMVCERNPDSWAEFNGGYDAITHKPGAINGTVGVASEYAADASPRKQLAGATVRGLGGSAVEIATSSDKPGTSHIVDLKSKGFSEVLRGNDGYDAVVTVRGEADPSGNIFQTLRIRCLPEHSLLDGSTEATGIPLLVPDSIPAATQSK